MTLLLNILVTFAFLFILISPSLRSFDLDGQSLQKKHLVVAMAALGQKPKTKIFCKFASLFRILFILLSLYFIVINLFLITCFP